MVTRWNWSSWETVLQVSRSWPRFCGIIIFIFDSYFSTLELLTIIFIFITTLPVSWMNQYEEVTLERKGNKCSRVEIIVLVTNGPYQPCLTSWRKPGWGPRGIHELEGMWFSQFHTVATVPWIWHPLSHPIEIWWLRFSECYNAVNLLQYREQYFLKSAAVRYIWMNLIRTIENRRFGLLAILPSL
jgi:hypothetical protein